MERKLRDSINKVETFKWLRINFYILHTYTKCGYISTLITVRIKYLLEKKSKTYNSD